MYVQIRGVSSESDIKRPQEFVHSSQQTLWCPCIRLDSGFTFEYDNSVSEVCSHDLSLAPYRRRRRGGTYEIVLDNKSSPLGRHDELLDNFTCVDTLFGIEVCGGFINEQNIGWDTEYETDGDSLQFSSGQSVD